MRSSEILRKLGTDGNGAKKEDPLVEAALRAVADRAQGETNRIVRDLQKSEEGGAVTDRLPQVELDRTASLTAERGRTHGDFRDVAAVEQGIKRAMRASPHWDGLPDAVRCSLEMIAHKQARIISGRWDFREHWDDVEGYSRCVSRELP